MAPVTSRLIPAFQLTRIPLVLGAATDAWFVILYTRGDARYNHVPAYEMPLLVDLIVATVVSIGLFAFAATLNDLFDLRHDAAFSPDRPLPSGRIRAGQAVNIAIGSLLAAIAAAIPFGNLALIFAVLAATGILFYDAVAKHLPAIGVTVAGLIHVAHMMIPNYDLAFTPPVWLIFTHVLGITALTHVLEAKRPRFRRFSVTMTVIGWLACSFMIIGLGVMRGPDGGFAPGGLGLRTAIWPGLALAAFIAVAWWKVSKAPGQVGAEKLRRYGAAWHAIYAAAWFAGLGRWTEAAVMVLIGVVGLVTMTLLREVSVDDPGLSGYRV